MQVLNRWFGPLALVVVTAACSAPAADDLSSSEDAVKLPKKDVDKESTDTKVEEALVGVRSVAQERKLPNGWLVAGIAKVETQLTHCYDHASFHACPGAVPGAHGKVEYLTSPDCDDRPVVAGASDTGGCSQGGLGLFQLDSGSQSKTLAKWKDRGLDVLSLRGNVSAGMELLLGKIGSAAQAKHISTDDPEAWLRGIDAADRTDEDYEAYLGILAHGYNGWDWNAAGWKKQKTKYHEGIVAVVAMHDAAWWKRR